MSNQPPLALPKCVPSRRRPQTGLIIRALPQALQAASLYMYCQPDHPGASELVLVQDATTQKHNNPRKSGKASETRSEGRDK